MRVLVMGAGAIGSLFGGMLQTAGHRVTFVARGAHLAALRERGLEARGASLSGRLPPVEAVATPAAAAGLADLVLFTVKAYDTETAAGALRPALGPRSVVVTLQNGIESAERVGAIVGAGRVLIGTATVTATVTAPGVVVQTGAHCGIALAEPAGGVTARLEAVAAALREAGIAVTVGAEPGPVLWRKFVWLAPTATVASACGAAVGPILATAEGAALYRAAVAETVAVGRAAGVPLPDDAVDATLAMLAAMPEEKPSMLVDYERGRRVELEELTGAVVRLGRALGVPTPTYDTLYAALKVRALAAAGRS